MPSSNKSKSAGFSLIEILVVISIVALLVGIVFAGTRQWVIRAREVNVQTMLRQIGGSLTNYTAETRGSVPAIDPDIKNVIQALKTGGGEETERMLRTINQKFWVPSYSDADAVLIDSWNNEIEYIGTDGTNGTNTGEITTANQQPTWKVPYFASAGPDGEWGSFANGNPYEPDAEAKDNIFSFEIADSR